MTMEYINNLHLIQEVQNNPCLYDIKDPNYKDVDCRKSTWERICTALYRESWDEFQHSEKREAKAAVQKRWKALRDSFTKAYKILRTRDSYEGSGKRRKPYVYANQLEFLIPFIYPQSHSLDDEDQDFEELTIEEDSKPAVNFSEYSPQPVIKNTHPVSPTQFDSKPAVSYSSYSPQPAIKNSQTVSPTEFDSKPVVNYSAYSPQPVIKNSQSGSAHQLTSQPTSPTDHREESQRLKRRAEEESDVEFSDEISSEARNVEDDPDKMFLLSLLPSFKRIRTADKVDVQIEILQCIKRKMKP